MTAVLILWYVSDFQITTYLFLAKKMKTHQEDGEDLENQSIIT